jgi:hypothetical protein
MSDQDKLKVIQSSGQNAVVLLYMQGHIMLYLGFAEGRPWAISSISEYLRPCANDKVQTVRIDRIAISDLELGRDTERRSFLERIHTLAIFGI